MNDICKNFNCKKPSTKFFGECNLVENLNKNDFDINLVKDENRNLEFLELSIKDEKFFAVYTYFGKIYDIDFSTFEKIGGKYSKDKNHVYYKNEIIGADPETFIYEKGRGKAIGKGRDKNGTWIRGVLK